MTETTQTAGVSDQDVHDLEQFAEKSLEADQLSEVLEEVPSLIQRGTIYIISAAILIMLALLYFGKVYVVVSVKGTIFPEGEAIQVLALASGVTTQVLAEAGDHLLKGTPIIKFSHQQSDLDLASMQRNFKLQQNQLNAAQEAALVVKEILSDPERFLSSNKKILITGSTMQVIASLKKAWLDLQKAGQMQKKDFKDKMRLMQREIVLAEQNILLKVKNRAAAEKEFEQQKGALKGKRQRYDEFLELARRGFYSNVDVDNESERYRSAELAIAGKEKEIDQMKLGISNERLGLADKKIRLKTEEANAGERYETARMNYQQSLTSLLQEQENLRTQIEKLEAEIKTASGKITLMESQISYGAVTMPADGIITQLKVKTPGESIGSGSVVAVMVADSESLMVKASAKSKDVGFVTKGLPARIKVDAYPFQQFGTVPGRVTKVFPNIGGDGNFTVKLELLKNKIKYGDQDILLSPGLTVKADLLTRKQRLIHMLLTKDKKKGKGKK